MAWSEQKLSQMGQRWQRFCQKLADRFLGFVDKGLFAGVWLRGTFLIVIFLFLFLVGLGIYWSIPPSLFNVETVAKAQLEEDGGKEFVPGYILTATLIHEAETLLHKPGGYIRNDLFPPGVWLDNMPHFELGLLTQIRDLTRAMRRSFSRSQSQSLEDPYLVIADPQFHTRDDRWILPATEGEYQKAVNALKSYRKRLLSHTGDHSVFYTRADNLNDWLSEVSKRLGSLSHRLTASVAQQPSLLVNAVDKDGSSSRNKVMLPRTSWFHIDDVFYEARGTTWALTELFQAAAIDFSDVLKKKNAVESFQQIIRDLESSQQTLWSPIILNGSGFGILANHSLTMAAYIAQANAALIDLRELLSQG